MTIQRYDLTEHSRGMTIWHDMQKNNEGDYVLYEDHQEAVSLLAEALAQREEELAAERRKNRELSSAIGRARELLRDSAGPFDEATMILAVVNP